ncbi:MAG: T9SS type A sorting domain-containing protein [Bacteroidetes bacterium]|nr:T9SS type A sorting domain-containing protein [Bacteroidota bacterium]
MKKNMIKNLVLLCCISALLALFTPVKAQLLPLEDTVTTRWDIRDLGSPDAIFSEVQEKANAYFEAHPEMDSLNPMEKATYRHWEAFWQNRSTFVKGDTVIRKLGEVAREIASLDYVISPTVGKKWMLITPDKDNYQDMGVVSCVWSKPGDPDYILAGTASSGLWKTTDGGLNWNNITDSYTGQNANPTGFFYHYPFGVVSIAVSPFTFDTILIAATIPFGFGSFGINGFGILKSIDGGNTWSKTNLFPNTLPLPNYILGLDSGITKIIFDPVNPKVVYAIGGDKIYCSSDLFIHYGSTKPFSDPQFSSFSQYQKLNLRDIEILDIPETNTPVDRKIFLSTDSRAGISAQLIVAHAFNSNLMFWDWKNITNSLSSDKFKDVIAIARDNIQNSDCETRIHIAYQVNETDPTNATNNRKFCVDQITRDAYNTNIVTLTATNYLYHNEAQTSPCAGFGYYYDNFEWYYENKSFVVGGFGITFLRGESTNTEFANYATCNYTTPYSGGTIPADEGYGKNKTLHFGVRGSFTFKNDTGNPQDLHFTTFVGTDGGISKIKHSLNTEFHTIHVDNLKNINGKGLAIQQFNDIATTKNNATDVIVGGAMHNGYWGRKTENANWDNYWFDDGGRVVLDDSNPDFLYAISYSTWNTEETEELGNQYTQGGYFLRSNQGLSSGLNSMSANFSNWLPFAAQIPPTTSPTLMPPLIIDHTSSNTLYLGGRNVYKSTNNGTTWDAISGFPSNNHTQALRVIAQSPSNPTIMYAAFKNATWCEDANGNNFWTLPDGPNCWQTNTHKLWKKTGNTWTDISQNVGYNALTWVSITDIAINATNPNEVWITFGGAWHQGASNANNGVNRVLYSADSGNTWTDISAGLSCLSVNCIRFIKDNTDPTNYTLVVGTDAGVYIRGKNDSQWTPYRDGMPLAIVTDIEIWEKGGKIRAATWGRGIWEADIPCINTVPEFYAISQNTDWNTDKITTGISIQQGSTLTITSKIHFTPNATVIVDKGAKLIIDGGTLQACPGYMWQGIHIYGLSDAANFDEANHAIVEIRGNGTIKDAITGIENVGGGLVYMDHANFVNNQRAILMDEPSTGMQQSNSSYFLNGKFTVNDTYHDPVNYPFQYFVQLNNVNKLNILGCTFENNTTPNTSPSVYYPSAGKGIISYSSVFTVADRCNNPNGVTPGTPCPSQYTTKSEFHNLQYGIYATSDNVIKNFTVRNAAFDNNFRGIYAMNINNAVFTYNKFKTINFAFPGNGNSFPAAYGLYLNTCSGYTVEGNQFNKSDSYLYASLGLVVHNSGNAINTVYNNRFSNIKYAATQAQDNNRGTTTDNGLKIKCNDYLFNKQDIAVLQNTPLSTVGISYYQGAPVTNPSIPSEWTKPAGNTFSKDGTTAFTDYNNTQGQNINYYHHNGTDNDFWVPKYCNPEPKITKISTTAPYTTKEQVCPSIANTGEGLPHTHAELFNAFSGSIIQLNSAKLILQIWVDGGNTELLKQEVKMAYPWEAYELYNNLLGKSPYLSDDVLMAAIQNESGLPPLMLKLILLANPQAVRSDRVMKALFARENPFPEEWIYELKQGLAVISPRENLEADVAFYATERKTYLDLLKKDWLADTTATAAQSLLQLLSEETDVDARYELAFAQLANKNTEAANATFAAIEQLLLPDDKEAKEKYYHMKQIFPIISKIEIDGIGWDALQEGERALINDYSENNDQLPGMLAKSIRLRFDNEYTYEEPIYKLRDEELKMATENKLNKPAIVAEQNFKISPNPAKEFMVVSYVFNQNTNGLRLVISNALGKIVYSKTLNKSKDELLITLKGYTSGNYIATIFNGGKAIKSSKFVVE